MKTVRGSKDNDLLDAIRRLTVHGVAPSYDALAAELGLNSKSGVHRRVHAQAALGYLRLRRDRARSIELIDPLEVEIRRLIELYGAEAVRKAVAA